MTLIAIHQVRTKKGAPPEPVGVWAIDDEDSESSFYPPEHEKYRPRAQKALMQRPPQLRLMDWVEYKAKTSSNWRILDPFHDMFGLAFLTQVDSAMEDTYRQVHDEYLSEAALVLSQFSPRDWSLPTNGNDESAAQQYPQWGSTRFAISQSWWLASELVRRHPELIVYEMHPGDGMYDVLYVTTAEQLSPRKVAEWVSPEVRLNRVGTVQVHHGGHSHVVGDWSDVMTAPTPHTILKELEGITGWGSPEMAPPTTSRSVAYRFLATALTLTMNDRRVWDARHQTNDGVSERYAESMMTVPTIVDDLRVTPRLGIWGEPDSHFWALLRGKEPIVTVSMEGKLYYASGKTVDLMTAYDQHDRKMIPMTTALLTKWM